MADRKQLNHTMYDHMVFPEYEYAEFPMAVPVVDGVVQDTPYDENHKHHEVVIVGSQAELDALKGPGVVLVPINPDAVTSAQRVESEDDIREALYEQAKQLGVNIDKRWSVPRIEDTLKAASAPKDVV